ncbi:MAG: hypothetical protein RR357_03560 [Clostridia bacterium]
MFEGFFSDVSGNIAIWASNPMHIVGVTFMLASFLILLFAGKINKKINKKREGDFTLTIKAICLSIVVVSAFLTVL